VAFYLIFLFKSLVKFALTMYNNSIVRYQYVII